MSEWAFVTNLQEKDTAIRTKAVQIDMPHPFEHGDDHTELDRHCATLLHRETRMRTHLLCVCKKNDGEHPKLALLRGLQWRQSAGICTSVEM